MEQIKFGLFQIIRQAMNRYRLDDEVIDICMTGLSKSTRNQYEHHLKALSNFCTTVNHFDFLNIPLNIGLHYLKSLHDEGKSYSVINTARSAISQFVTIIDGNNRLFGEHVMVKRFMMGIYKLKPPLPKYTSTWDVKPLLDYLRSISNDADLKSLSIKLVCLLALATGQRLQTLAALDLSLLTINSDKASFRIGEILKTSKPGKTQLTVHIHKFTTETLICPLECLQSYLHLTDKLRTDTKLFISLQKPHKSITSQTLSRWVTWGLQHAGIHEMFTPHSVRHASSSRAAGFIPVGDILKTVGWTRESTFASFYRRETNYYNGESFSEAVLNGE